MPVVTGRAAIEALLQGATSGNSYSEFLVTPARTTVYDSIRAGQYGSFREVFRPKAGKVDTMNVGRYAAGYAKGPNGWQVRYLIGFNDSTKAVTH